MDLFVQVQNMLESINQGHLLDNYNNLTDEQKVNLLNQIVSVNWNVLDVLKNKQEESVKSVISPIEGYSLAEIKGKEAQFLEVGIEALKNNKVGAVLLAGGQGTRLGSDNPKGMYDIGITKPLYIFECLINNMLDIYNAYGVYVPLYVMTSDKNHSATVNFFTEHNFFNYPESYIKFFQQEMAPAVDFDGKVLMEAKDKLALSPNGNGGWFSSLAKAGFIEDIDKRGIEWLNVFAVDNVCQRIADPKFVGATILSGCKCGAKAVSKANPTEKVGVLCLENGCPSIVEYYELTEEMANSRNSDGTLTYRYGVILNYLFNLEKLKDIMNANIPVHTVKKKVPYIDKNGNLVKPETENGIKFETLVLDMIKLMETCLPYEVKREYEFAPIKNKTGVDSVESARKSLQKNGVTL